ncbi:MAG: hypothetical protein ABSD03_18305 [Vulcanimicrobiaceae bacterium]
MRAPLATLAAVLLVLALAAQLVADGLYGALAVTPSLPRALAGDWPFALAERTGLDHIPGVRVALARGALVREEPARAVALLAPLGSTADVVDLRGRAALLLHDPVTAMRDFIAAGDFIAGEGAIDALGDRDPRAALALVGDFETKLIASGRAPEITAEVEWREGGIAADAALRYPAQAAAYDRASVDAFARALARAPNDEKYLLNYAMAALRNGDAEVAKRTYQRAAEVVPDSVDAFVGVAVTTADLGECAPSRAAWAQAHAYAAELHRIVDEPTTGYAPDVRAAFVRCNG